MNNQTTVIEFSVKIKYSTNEGSVICKESAQENLLTAIENERQNGALTPADISAESISVNEVVNKKASVSEIISLNMADITGEYDLPDGMVEWEWVENNAAFSHQRNGESGIWDFMLHASKEHTNIPEKLVPVIESAIKGGYSYILFNQGT
jgi:hypothetical protein